MKVTSSTVGESLGTTKASRGLMILGASKGFVSSSGTSPIKMSRNR